MAARGQIHFWAEIYHHGEEKKTRLPFLLRPDKCSCQKFPFFFFWSGGEILI